jgi:hypothetical protein
LNTIILRHFQSKIDEPWKDKPSLTPPYQRENLKNKIVSRETILNVKLNYFLIAMLVSFLFIGLFDHYFWTLQQGRLMFWLVLGLILVNSNIMSKEDKY